MFGEACRNLGQSLATAIALEKIGPTWLCPGNYFKPELYSLNEPGREEELRDVAKLRHIALQVPDLETAAQFYEKALELTRVAEAESPIGNAIMLSDGIMNLTLLAFPEGTKGAVNGPGWAGLHHFGFVVDDERATARKIEENGGSFFMRLPDTYPGVDAEAKFKDPLGIVFDIAEHDWKQVPKA
jgi:catechol 2,3-dioxygenase-like lactoylglutathione lyase family enzyme